MIQLVPRKLDIPAGARVLEIGSGSRPHPQATVLLERFADDSSHREGRRLETAGKPLVIADGQALPFKDKSFDYCICMHVLEHVDDPARLIAEMERVAGAGYIETPSELFEHLFAVPPYTEIHKWYVNLDEGGGLVITPKVPEQATHRFAYTLDWLRREDPDFERWMEKSPHLFTVQYEWRDTIIWRQSEQSPAVKISSDQQAQAFINSARPDQPYYWGSGTWGLKRWFYSQWVHPRWRKFAKRIRRALRKDS